MAITKTDRAGEPIYFGTASEISDLLDDPAYLEYGIWTDQTDKFALCRVWPCPSWIELTRREFYQRAGGAL